MSDKRSGQLIVLLKWTVDERISVATLRWTAAIMSRRLRGPAFENVLQQLAYRDQLKTLS